MKIPFGDLKLHYQAYKNDFDSAVQRVLASGYYILGPELERFEKEFATWLGAEYVVGCASGTEAIYLALAAAGVGPQDEVIVVAHTAVPTISGISMTGATPIFVDIDPKTYVMDVAAVEARITPKTKAIVPVHLYGQMVDMEPLMKLAAKHNLVVMEDCAQSTGATYGGRKSGTLTEFGAFSFYPSKNLGAFGDGGAVTCKTKENYDKLIKLRNYGSAKRYYHDSIGINSRLDEIQAAILSCQIPYLDEWNERRRQIAKRYSEGLKDVVVVPTEADNRHHVYHLYVIQVDSRDELQNYLLEEKGIQTIIHYPVPAHLQNAYAYLGYKPGNLPNTEYAAKRILSLPMQPELKDEQVDEVIAGIRQYFKSANTSANSVTDSISPVTGVAR